MFPDQWTNGTTVDRSLRFVRTVRRVARKPGRTGYKRGQLGFFIVTVWCLYSPGFHVWSMVQPVSFTWFGHTMQLGLVIRCEPELTSPGAEE